MFEVTHYTQPYHYAIVDNVFPSEILKELKTYYEHSNKFKRYTHMDHRYGITLKKQTDNKIIDYLYSILPIITEGFRKELDDRRLPNDDSKYLIRELVCCLDKVGYSIHAHHDTFLKWITMVIYINGEGSTTTVMSSDNSDYCDIENKPNSALIFVPSNNTWHRVKETDKERQTLQCMFGVDDKSL